MAEHTEPTPVVNLAQVESDKSGVLFSIFSSVYKDPAAAGDGSEGRSHSSGRRTGPSRSPHQGDCKEREKEMLTCLFQGYFVKPTVFGNVLNSHTVAREEIFGPVLSVIGYSSLDEAVAIANDNP